MSPQPRRIDWGAARAFYVALDPPRSCARVARRFGVSDTAVRNHAKAEGWADEAEKADAKAAEKGLAAAVRTREQRVMAALRSADLVIDKGTEELEQGRPEGVYARIPEFVKLAELLSGEATDRVSIDEMQTGLRISIGLAISIAEVVAGEIFDGDADRFVKVYRERYLAEVNAQLGAGE